MCYVTLVTRRLLFFRNGKIFVAKNVLEMNRCDAAIVVFKFLKYKKEVLRILS